MNVGHPRPRAIAPAVDLDPLWYKDAIIYQIHVKSFFDANNDGIGDFPGLISRLDYIAELGVNTIWLLPFYPSPRLDDGYDIADYRGVHPDYGTLADVKRFIAAAHDRGAARGSGLGLALVRDHVRACGGTITVMESPDGGARFQIAP